MIYIDFERELVATENNIFDQIKELDDFVDYCREYWLFDFDSYSKDFQDCCHEIVEDHDYRDIEDILITEDLPGWYYLEIQSALAGDWIAENYKMYYEPNRYGEILKAPFCDDPLK